MHKQRGSALICALFIVTLVAIAATAMSVRLQRDIYRTHLIVNNDTLYLASQSVTFWAMDKLANPAQHFIKTKPHSAARVALYPTKLSNFYPGVKIRGSLHDMQAYFNLNNVQDKNFHVCFIRLIKAKMKKKDKIKPITYLNTLISWISPYQLGHGVDKQSHQRLHSISELRLLKGYKASLYQALLPAITALPEVTPININTAPKSILKLLGNGLNDAQVETLLEVRKNAPIIDLKNSSLLLTKLKIPSYQVTAESQYFLSIARVHSQDLELTTYTIIQRKREQDKIITRIIYTSQNAL